MTDLMVLIVGHFIADFLLQTRWIAENKSENLKAMRIHIYTQIAVIWLFGLFTSMTWAEAGMVSLINGVVHAVIDTFIWRGYKAIVKYRLGVSNPELEGFTHSLVTEKGIFMYWKDAWFYNFIGFDQMLHTLTLIGVYLWIVG